MMDFSLLIARNAGVWWSGLVGRHARRHHPQPETRQIRIGPAAALLRRGDSNGTGAAPEVGYSSLGHFTKAFAAEMGVRSPDFGTGSSPREVEAHFCREGGGFGVFGLWRPW